MLLDCLPQEFENFRIAIESRHNIPEISVIKAKLIKEDARKGSKIKDNKKKRALYSRTSNKNKMESQKNSGVQNKFVGKCFECGKVGYRAVVYKTKLA